MQPLATIIKEWIEGTPFPPSPANLSVQISTNEPGFLGGTLLPPSGATPQSVTLSNVQTDADGLYVTNTNDLIFNVSSDAVISHIAVMDGNDFLFGGPIDTNVAVKAGGQVSIAAGKLKLRFSDVYSDYVQGTLFDWLKGTSPFPPPPTWLKVDLSTDGTDSGIPPITDGYASQQVFFTPFITQTDYYETSNDIPVVFGSAKTNSWGVIHYALVKDTSNNTLFKGQFATPRQVNIGEGFAIARQTMKLKIM